MLWIGVLSMALLRRYDRLPSRSRSTG